MSDHTKRLLIAIIAIPIIIFICFKGEVYFFGMIALISALAIHEFYKLAELKGAKPQIVLGVLSGFAINLSFYHVKLSVLLIGFAESLGCFIPFPTQTQLLFMTVVVVIIVLSIIELFKNNGSTILNLTSTIFGVVYISLFFGTLIGLRELFVPFDFPVGRYFPDLSSFNDPVVIEKIYNWGGFTIISLFAIIWICDSAAYYIGSALGKHKLFPRVSPNKSWEGAIAGFIFAIIASITAKLLVLEYLPLGSAIILGIIVGIFGQIGDLFESLLKRDAGVKDSSTIIPGHGGILDRFDSLLFVSPLVYLYIDYILFS
ncbi:MAG: phosphatidate cytidylyltransferase [Ignavibacteriales bacterium]|nr:phosphatidate cytidylyltransferase [Ignavibacteriales bacterium]